MPNVFNYIKPTEKCARNAFDLGNKHVYSAKAGMIVPVKAIHTVPGDHFEIKISDFTQTFPMNTAAFLRGRKEFALYFVPYKQSWSNFNQYIATREDVYSSNMNSITYEPRMSLYDIQLICLEFVALYCHDVILPRVFKERSSDHSTLLDEINPTRQYIPMVLSSGFYNKTSTSYKAKDYLYDVFGYPRWNNVLRKLDMLGYGNFFPFFDTFIKNYESSINTTETITYAKFFELLNSALSYAKSQFDSFKNRYVNLYPITTYNKVYYDMFRNSYYELDYDVRNYNLDFKLCNNVSTSIVQIQDIPVTFFDIQYHQWKKDLFTAVLPDTQFGAVSLLPSSGDTSGLVALSVETSTDQDKWRTTKPWSPGSSVQLSSGNTKNLADAGAVSISHTHSVNGVATISGVTTSFDVLALKRAEALQGYRQALLRAGNKTSDVFRAVFGRAPRYDEDAHPYFIDAFGEDIFVDAVVSTAETNLENADKQTSSGKLGDLGGRALMNGNSDTIKFDSSDFGIILIVQYIVPQSEYNSYMLDPHLANLTPEDHWIPAFENLGFSPVIGEYLNNSISLPSDKLNRVVGYVPRYFEFKCDVDKVHGSFCEVASSSLYRGHAVVSGSSLVDRTASFTGELSHWVTPRSDMQATSTTLTRNFYVDPAVLDNVFLVAADGTYSTDQFICNTYLDVKAVRPMSVLGLPNF